ncbi:MAG: fumarate hydratase [Nitrospinae bacterium]|nr:fumarate hydratase [Nitrospinota bacterium]
MDIIADEEFTEAIVELIRRTSTILPQDVVERLKAYRDKEAPDSRAQRALDTILNNIQMAERDSRPICQDTGTVTFDIHYPFGMRQNALAEIIRNGVRRATSRHYLRPNVVDPITGAPKVDNTGRGHPAMYFDQWDEDYLKIDLVLKGGGCENVGTQYSLPYSPLGAGRDMDGIKKVCLDAVVKAQGKGCAPGVLGIGIGGDRAQSYLLSKKQLHRKLGDKNQDPGLADLEEWVVENSNKLGIGPMGFGGKTTLIGAKAAAMDTIPASYFVAVTYMCWAYRRRTMTLKGKEVSYD